MTEEKPGFFKRIGNFVAEVKHEVGKVTWPSRAELYGGTIVIVFVLVILCIGLGLADGAFAKAVQILMTPQ